MNVAIERKMPKEMDNAQRLGLLLLVKMESGMSATEAFKSVFGDQMWDDFVNDLYNKLREKAGILTNGRTWLKNHASKPD